MGDDSSHLDRAKQLFFRGLDHMDGGDLKAAEAAFRATLAIVPQHGPSLNNLALVLRKQNRIGESAAAAEAAVAIDKTNTDALSVLADCYREQRRYDESLDILRTVAALDPSNAEAFSNQSFILNRTTRHTEAVASAERALAIEPRHVDAHVNRANALAALRNYRDALAAYDSAIAIRPDLESGLIGRAAVLFRLDRFEEALKIYDRALETNPRSEAGRLGRAAVLARLKDYESSLAIYDRLLAEKPDLAEAWNGRGNVLVDLQNYREALFAFDKALEIDPALAASWVGRGHALYDLGQDAQALDAYCRATAIDPNSADGWQGRGDVCSKLKKYEDAIPAYDRALAIAPDLEFVRGSWLTAHKMICSWPGEAATNDILARAGRGEKVLGPFLGLHLTDAPALQQAITAIFADAKFPRDRALPAIGKYGEHGRIRLGYFSADLHTHATAFLISELIERHDRSRFEVSAFSFGPDQTDAMRERLRGAFDRFIDVGHLSDREAASLARSHEIDIAIDLKGFTTDSRPGIFAARAAPIQVSYLGFPGTMATNYIDYLIADPVVIPETQRAFYTEKIARLPDSYQVNDTKREISQAPVSRAACGLPEDGFVFCGFNVSFKLSAPMLDDLLAILKRVEGSVLWMLEDSAASVRNLRREVEARGVSQNRVVFAPRAPLPEHLARHRLADLFLDMLPVNAHTTASDALWAGLPVLTRQGEAFAGRVAASLLHAIGLPELIVTTREEYVALAVDLATNPDKLARIRDKLAANRLTTPLFDIQRFTTNIETLYARMYDRYRRDLPPVDIDTL
ncbi:MAG: tetratricopeptide repeat protein [Bradyrhizobiaceae bacterium]|nr:MAG: tetratricopeptide repeat protein [Bradyrhizobiaceae bacterium]